MRTILVMLAFISVMNVRAQGIGISYMPLSPFNNYHALNDSNHLQKNWSVSTYAGIGAGFAFFNNGSSAFFPASVGVQLNRRITNNVFAFAGVTAAPAFFNFYGPVNGNKNYPGLPGFNANNLGIYAGVHAGVMYVNDARTFSISGGISVSNNSYPLYPALQRQPHTVGSRQ